MNTSTINAYTINANTINANTIFSNSNNITEERNTRIFDRNLKVDGTVEYKYGIHPVSTKYSVLPILDQRTPSNTPINNNNNNATVFSNNVYTESLLRNQFFALQHGSPRSVYIPDSKSDLYNYAVCNNNNNNISEQQPFPLLFKTFTFDQGNNCPKNMGADFFNNCTRYQIGEIII